jgi:phosphotriesterase-related protein
MNKMFLQGKVQTVLGPIEQDQLGITLCHEHLFIDMAPFFLPLADEQEARAQQPITLENLSWIRSHRMSNLFNLQPFEEELAIEEVLHFKKAGGRTIVEVTPNNMGRAPEKLSNLAKASGLNIIMGTAYYRETQLVSQPGWGGNFRAKRMAGYPDMALVSENEIAEEFIRDITVGVADTGIRAGVIGEIGCSWPLTENERKVLRAAAFAQRKSGALLTVHPGFYEESPLEIIAVLTEAGADLKRVVMSHMSIAVGTQATRIKLAETGCYLEWDLFGWDSIFPPQPTPIDIPSDQGRIRQIIQMIEEGYVNQVLISQDICARIRLARYGGTGYAHILDNIVPIMIRKGISESNIEIIMVKNPQRALDFV